jgi:hypothetical protein
MSETELNPDTLILDERNYEAALNLVIAKAQNKLLIFDQDFVSGNYSSTARFELLSEFLSHNDLSKMTIILQSTEHFVNNCPRLFKLLKLYGHKITVF